MVSTPLKAVISDLDGVITRTAALHAKAWKQVFDEYLEQRRQEGESLYEPFDVEKDYRSFVDGKPRYKGVSSFLESREIRIQEGSPSDKPGWTSICAIGNRKNEIFRHMLGREGAEVFIDAVDKIKEWHKKGYKTAVVSSSKNCRSILQSAHLESLFDISVDGVIAEKLNLSSSTVDTHYAHIKQKLGLKDTTELVQFAVNWLLQEGKNREHG